ncbi:MAG TPA: glycosyltransferase [Thermoplasmata archaeon]|nr:glycosyltransferase [Thermoplasmata archaeon]
MATYNSGATLGRTLDSVRRLLPGSRIIVIDRESTDATPSLAARFGAEFRSGDFRLGQARNLALQTATTDPVLFVDSDVEITRPDFLARAFEEYRRPRTAAVVGVSEGHSFQYGLPLGLTLVGRRWALSAGIPDDAQGRETYYLQRAARRDRLRVRYVARSMRHDGTYRRARHWPEFQGAAIRLSSGWSLRELAYAAIVVLLMHMNSRSARNVLYSPWFYAKIVRGFLDPRRWIDLPRSGAPAPPIAGPTPAR